MSKIKLPKSIQNDPQLRQECERLGMIQNPKPKQEQIQQQEQPKPQARPRGNGDYWRAIREAWLRKQTPRKCANPNCKKEPFLPKVPMQRYCCRNCYLDSKRKTKRPIQTTCKCGRHSKSLIDGMCSFCYANYRKLIAQEKAERNLGRNRCRKCGSVIDSRIKNGQNKKFRLCTRCFPIVFERPVCPRCHRQSFVRLSMQTASEPNTIIWYCSKDDFVFPQTVELRKELMIQNV